MVSLCLPSVALGPHSLEILNKLARVAQKFFTISLISHDFKKKFLTNWRAQRGKIFTISLICHDFLKKFLTNWRAQRGKFLLIPLFSHDFSPNVRCVDKMQPSAAQRSLCR